MIYTVTFNPALDYIASVEGFKTGATNRTTEELLFPGGKGINVSLMLRNLGVESIALGFVGGFTGAEIRRLLDIEGIKSDFIEVPGYSRINVKLRSDSETEINGKGPEIGKNEISLFYNQLNETAPGDTLVLAGSIPVSMPDTTYMEILKTLESRDIRVVVDATGNLLMNTLEYHPFLIKPNKSELEEICESRLKTTEEIISAAKGLQEKGARNVLVSMAGDGAVLLSETGEVYSSLPPKGEVKNSVGAGDSMVAGFIAGFIRSESCKEAFYMGLCAGSASAFSHGFGTAEEVEALKEGFLS